MLLGRKPIGTCAVLAGVPAVATEFMWAWSQVVAYNAEYLTPETNKRVHYIRSTVSFHSWARNDLVERMEGDWLYMQDCDHAPPPDIVARLVDRMQFHDLDVVTGAYVFRRYPHPPVLYGWQGGGGMCILGGWDPKLPLFEVAGAGGGCLLVRRRVFDRIRDELGERPFDVIGQGGEDLGFFHRLRRLGVRAFVDTRVECPHLTTRPLTLADYDRSQAQTAPLDNVDAIVP